MIIVYILSVFWGIGCLAALIAVVRLASDFDYSFRPNWLGLIFSVGLGTPVAVFVGILPWAFIAYDKSPDLATLKKHEWACSASHVETTYVMSGKVMVPVTNEICDQYNRL